MQTESTVTVPVRQLDRVMEPVPNAMIKIDAQGAEYTILGGGRNVVSAARLVLIEHTFRPLYQGQALFNELHARLDDFGFDLIGFRTQETDQDGVPQFAHAIYSRRLQVAERVSFLAWSDIEVRV